ncbi:MAG TPA: kelch repeat-containing protein [Verrucomicrobiae bacterium]|nr:kelch repeat-containing protein [Verrucomicrobiae bacterium]
MVVPRSGATATLLTNGMVLIAGGRNTSTFQTINAAELYDPTTGQWTATGSMNTPRLNHTATLLPDGKVLVAGGTGTNFLAPPPFFTTLTNAEVYDPATGVWTPTAGMIVARRQHTASLLPNGKVLVAGGTYDLSGRCELYDPAAGTWTLTGTMTTNRQEHTATVLTNGMVLVAGGEVSVGFNLQPTATAELYNPNTGAWTATGSMTTNRFEHSATLLNSGKVLVEGGTATSSSILETATSAELYDPVSGTWTETGSMFFGADEHIPAVLLPDGEVLVAGGGIGVSGYNPAQIYNPDTGEWSVAGSILGSSALGGNTLTLLGNGQVLLAGNSLGSFGGLIDAPSAQLYNPDTAWKGTGSLNIPRLTGFTLTLLTNGDVLIAGGSGTSGVKAGAELYHPATGQWTPTGDMTSAREFHTATLLADGEVLVAGGENENGDVQGSVELYNPVTGQWAATNEMHFSRERHTATLLKNGKVLVAGGGTTVPSAELYDPATGTWTVTGSMNSPRWFHSAVLLNDGKVLVSGGVGNGTSSSSAEIYDPGTGGWTLAHDMNAPRNHPVAAVLPNGKVFVADFYSAALRADIYDPAENSWTATSSTTNTFSPGTATLLTDGRILLAGAGGNNPAKSASAEIYDPATDTWTNTFGPMTSIRAQQQAVRLPNGKVLVAGGNSEEWTGDIGITAELFDPNAGGGTSPSIVLVPSPTFTGGAFEFNFTATAGQTFTVWSTTNISKPFDEWTSLGPVIEVSPGIYQFSDSQAASLKNRFYRISKP